MYADLHLHSTYSDGTDSPEKLADLAEKNGVAVISITDHDTTAAYRLANGSLKNKNVRIISGAEISTEINHQMIHVLGYFIDTESADLADFLHHMALEKTESTRLNFENAVSQGIFNYEWDNVTAKFPGLDRISGTCITAAMEADGYLVPGMTYSQLKGRYFWPQNPKYVSRCTVTAFEAIDVIKKAGGISVLAHPFLFNDDEMIIKLIRHGLNGIEVFHPAHGENERIKYGQIAKDNNLLISGGTDWHGANSREDITCFGMHGLPDDTYKILNCASNE
ncbi:MAG: PHP domain-containing protein [Defluviitaleaceae bacterium]|nr:PHP domain-containing protein [Defluviitaleaceae bacterium]